MLEYFQKAVASLKQEKRYREFLDISRICGDFPYAINNKNGQKIIVWCSNDYLAMGQNNSTIDKVIESLKSYGIGAGGTRNISGNNIEIVRLEKKLANLHDKESALSFTSGYVANDATIQALAKIIPDLVIFSDEKNHASIISGIRHSRLKKHIFKHNDINDLENLLKIYPKETPKIIIFESVYSMDGDFGDVLNIVKLAKKYGCLTYIDEVHGVGLYGEKGAGRAEELKINSEIDIIQGTFGKAFGVVGGYITAKSEIIDAIRSISSGFIFTTALPPIIATAVLENINYNIEHAELRYKLHDNVKKIKLQLVANNIDIVSNDSHIISIKIGSATKAKEISQILLEKFNIYIQHINYPTVAKGDERLRITTSPMHNDEMIENLINALRSVIK
jgi:5-aminolevulinate synthase